MVCVGLKYCQEKTEIKIKSDCALPYSFLMQALNRETEILKPETNQKSPLLLIVNFRYNQSVFNLNK